MAYATEPPTQGFRLSQLIYDTRYRGITIQVVTLVLVIAALSWLLGNLSANLAAKGKDIDFSFLWSRAGYDIGQTLIPYTNDDNHFRAAMVGLVNTLVVALLAAFLSTVLGVLIGVLRLSKNWLVSRLMGAYVELLRNIPLVLWIVLTYAILSEAAPEPKDFKVVDGVAKQEMFLGIAAVTNRYTTMPAPTLDRPLPEIAGVPTSGLAVILVLMASFWALSLIRRRATRVQEATGLRPGTFRPGAAVLVLPVVALLITMGFHLDYPEFKGFNFKGGLQLSHAFTAMVISLSLYYAAVTAEVVRGGVQAISRGQSEAAFALGLRPGRTMSLVILPQALRVIIPPQISNYLSLVKDTSLGIAASYLDLRGTLGGITSNQTGRELECMLLMMGIYLSISLILSAALNFYNASVKLKER
jgi:general L-amino acid transport system permease protein